MAISWGATSGNFRLGINVEGGYASGAFISVYGQSVRFGHTIDPSVTLLTRTGGWSGTSRPTFYSAPSATVTKQLYRVWVAFTGTRTFGANMSFWNGYVSVSRSVTVTPPSGPDPSTPKPAAPANLYVERYANSDYQTRVRWERMSTYTSVKVQRRTWGGNWQSIATAGGNVWNYVDTTTKPNERYFYRAQGVNAGGTSALSNQAWINTTPAAPRSVAATRSGADIVVDRDTSNSIAEMWDIEHNGVVIETALLWSDFPYRDESVDPTISHRYRVRPKVWLSSTDATRLAGAWSSFSNTVQLLAKPNAPVGLKPNGSLVVGDVGVPFVWAHNPVDSSDQSVYELRYRVGSAAWSTVSGTVDEFRDIALSADVYEWQVRTKGGHPDWSDWSATASVTVVDRPGVAVTAPLGGQPFEAAIVVAEWTFFQGQGRPQSSWRARLLDGDGIVLESKQGNGPTTTVTFATRLEDSEDYTVEVEAATGAIWSEVASTSFTTDFPLPGVPDVNVSWDDQLGSHTIVVEPTAGDVATETVMVERSLDGEVWKLVVEGLPVDESVVQDFQGRANGVTFYRVTAISALPSMGTGIFEAISDSGVMWLGGDVDYSLTARLPYDPDVSITAARERVVKRWAGRRLPVAHVGQHDTRTVSAGGRIDETDEGMSAVTSAITAVAQNAEPIHLYRDPDGRVIYGSLSDVSLGREFDRVWSFGFTVEETEH